MSSIKQGVSPLKGWFSFNIDASLLVATETIAVSQATVKGGQVADHLHRVSSSYWLQLILMMTIEEADTRIASCLRPSSLLSPAALEPGADPGQFGRLP
jgi:hypothetical protein